MFKRKSKLVLTFTTQTEMKHEPFILVVRFYTNFFNELYSGSCQKIEKRSWGILNFCVQQTINFTSTDFATEIFLIQKKDEFFYYERLQSTANSMVLKSAVFLCNEKHTA